jgi:hypothetical protein
MSKKSLAQPVTTENAGINTVSVAIRALHVNNKQMTLAVFRQIPHLDLINIIDSCPYEDRGLVDGVTLWGKVKQPRWLNYEVLGSWDGDLFRIDYLRDIKSCRHRVGLIEDKLNAERKKGSGVKEPPIGDGDLWDFYLDKTQEYVLRIAELEQCLDFQHRCINYWLTLEDLPQLFIAV